MTRTAEFRGSRAARQPSGGTLRPALAVLGVILVVNLGLATANTLIDSPWRLDASPLRLAGHDEGPQAHLRPAAGWRVDQARSDPNPLAAMSNLTLTHGATTMTLHATPSRATPPALWRDVQRQLTQRPDITRVGPPRPVATRHRARGLQAPLTTSNGGGGVAAVYADGQLAVQVTAYGRDYPRQAKAVAAMLGSLRFTSEGA